MVSTTPPLLKNINNNKNKTEVEPGPVSRAIPNGGEV